MAIITRSGGPVEGLDGPVNSAVLQLQAVACVHCQAVIRFKHEASCRGNRLESDHSCPACQHRPICVRCGNDQLSGVPCPGPYRHRARMGAT